MQQHRDITMWWKWAFRRASFTLQQQQQQQCGTSKASAVKGANQASPCSGKDAFLSRVDLFSKSVAKTIVPVSIHVLGQCFRFS